MGVVLSIMGLIATLIVDHFAANKFCLIAEEKGYNAKDLNVYKWCFIFPAIGYAYVIALPDLNLQKHTIAIEYILEEIINLNTEQTESIDDSVNQNQED